MEDKHRKALVVAFYLSKFDKTAYERLSFENKTKTHKRIGEILDVKPNTIKNMRDQFDYVLDNDRRGWQKELSKSRLQTFERFDDLEENSLFTIVTDILNDPKLVKEPELKEAIDAINENEDGAKRNYSFSALRGKTGQAAEDYFMTNFKRIFSEKMSIKDCTCNDTRTHGCGYDFEVTVNNHKKYVEIKGLSDVRGNVLFTDKEWGCALKHKTDYILIVIKNMNNTPEVEFIENPASKFSPKRKIQRIVQVNWILENV